MQIDTPAPTSMHQPDLFGGVLKEWSLEPKEERAWFQKAPANDSAFRRLPPALEEYIGLTTHMGARIDLAVLSAFAYWLGLPENQRPRVLDYHDDHCLLLNGEEAVISIQSVAEDLYARWYGERFRNPMKDEHFYRFYHRVRASVGRLKVKGLLVRIDYARPGSKGLYGTRWDLGDSPTSDAVRRCRPIAEPGSGVNVVDVIGDCFVAENPRPEPELTPCPLFDIVGL